MKLMAFQNGDRRTMARVLDDKALPFADLDEFWPTLSGAFCLLPRRTRTENRLPILYKCRRCRTPRECSVRG
jgi:hypothetical protein